MIKTQHPTQPGFIGAVDNARRKRLLDLCDLTRSSERQIKTLEWPDYYEQERTALNDLALDGPKTIIPLARQLSGYSQLLRAGVPMISTAEYSTLVMPSLNRALEADWSATSPDIGGNAIAVSSAEPRRLSAYVVVSDMLRVQNELLVGAWLEQQLLASVGRALDKAALVGTGANNQPTGLLNDTGINSHTRASNGINSLADMAAMEKAIADNNGEDNSEDYLWVSDTATRETLRNTPATAAGTTFGRSLWEPQPANNLGRSGVMGYEAIASVHAPANTLILAQKRAMAFVDFNKLQVENLVDAGQAKEGFRTMLVSGYFDFAILEPNGICKPVNS